MYDIIVFAKASKIASSLWWWPVVVAIHPGKCRLQFLWSIQSWNTLKIHPSLTGEGGVRQDSFSNLFWSADLRCKLSAFEESWDVRCAEMHLWDITCARQTRKKDETRTPKSGGTLPAIENSWHVLEQTKHSRLCTKCHKTFPILSQTRISIKIHRFTVSKAHHFGEIQPFAFSPGPALHFCPPSSSPGEAAVPPLATMGFPTTKNGTHYEFGVLLLMVQKSQGQPPGMVLKTL